MLAHFVSACFTFLSVGRLPLLGHTGEQVCSKKHPPTTSGATACAQAPSCALPLPR